MKEAIQKEKIRIYAEDLLQPEEVENIELYTSINEDAGEFDAWLLETDTGNEYWVFEGTYPANIVKKSGIYTDIKRAFEAYIVMANQEELQVMDRNLYL